MKGDISYAAQRTARDFCMLWYDVKIGHRNMRTCDLVLKR